MATTNPRITITLTPELHAVLKRLSVLTSNSQSAIVAELLTSSLPVFSRMCAVLEAASKLKEQGLSAPQAVRDSLERAQERLEKQMNLALETMEEGSRPLLHQAEKVTRRSGGAGGSPAVRGGTAKPLRSAPTPVLVTRGSGSSTPRPKRTTKGGTNGPL